MCEYCLSRYCGLWLGSTGSIVTVHGPELLLFLNISAICQATLKATWIPALQRKRTLYLVPPPPLPVFLFSTSIMFFKGTLETHNSGGDASAHNQQAFQKRAWRMCMLKGSVFVERLLIVFVRDSHTSSFQFNQSLFVLKMNKLKWSQYLNISHLMSCQ